MKSTYKQNVNLSTLNEFCWCGTQQWGPTGSFGGVTFCPSINPSWLGISTGLLWSTVQPIATQNHPWGLVWLQNMFFFQVLYPPLQKVPIRVNLIYLSPSAYMTSLPWCFCGISNYGIGCVSDSFSCPWMQTETVYSFSSHPDQNSHT